MRTKEEIFDRLMQYLDFAVREGFFTNDEVCEIDILENEYYIQED